MRAGPAPAASSEPQRGLSASPMGNNSPCRPKTGRDSHLHMAGRAGVRVGLEPTSVLESNQPWVWLTPADHPQPRVKQGACLRPRCRTLKSVVCRYAKWAATVHRRASTQTVFPGGWAVTLTLPSWAGTNSLEDAVLPPPSTDIHSLLLMPAASRRRRAPS